MVRESQLTRREMLVSTMRALATGAVAGTIIPALADATSAPTPLTVYKDPSCGCCTKWVTHMREKGFAPKVSDRSDMDALKDSMGIPVALRSCHTAIAGKYLIEGHVPAADVKRLLRLATPGVVGLAAPGMPSGSPGMEGPGTADRYSVIAFTLNGTASVFAHHG